MEITKRLIIERDALRSSSPSDPLSQWTNTQQATITLFTPQFALSNTHPQVTLNNSLLPCGRFPCILEVTFDPHFKFNSHVKSIKALAGTNWGQQKKTILNTNTYPLFGVPPTDYRTTIKSFHTKAVYDSKYLLSHNRVLQTVSRHIAPEESNLPRPYRSTLSQLHSSFCSSLHSCRERIGLIPSPLCPSGGVEPHTTVQAFSCSSHPTPLTGMDLWERPCLASKFLFSLPFFDLPPFPLGGQESLEQSSSPLPSSSRAVFVLFRGGDHPRGGWEW